jgi:hypothetical protein
VADAFETSFDVLKVSESLGLVFGWGMLCDTDLDGERITQLEMLKSVTEFSLHSERPTDEMHDEQDDGTVVHGFPLTDEVAEAFGISCDKRGWMVAVKPSPDVLAKFADGTYTGFSIGGTVAGWEADDDQAVA